MFEKIFNSELAIDEVISIGSRMFVRNKKDMLKIFLIYFLPIGFLMGLIQYKTNLTLQNSMMNVAYMMPMWSENGNVWEMFLFWVNSTFKIYGEIWPLQVISIIIYVCLYPMGLAAVSIGVKQEVCGEEVSVNKNIKNVLTYILPIALVGIIYYILIGLAGILFIIPGIYLMVTWTFYICSVVLSEKRAFKALSYSGKLVKKRWWKTLGFLLVIQLILMGFMAIMMIIAFMLFSIIAPVLLRSGNFDNINNINIIFGVIAQWIGYALAMFVQACTTILFLNREKTLL